MKDTFKKIQKVIHERDHFLLVTHVNPDGDGIGSQIALHRFLKREGKNSTIISGNPSPENYHFLEREGEIEVYDSVAHQQLLSAIQVVFILDISNPDRLGKLGPVINESSAIKICIDHHVSNFKFAEVNLIDQAASSTGELVYRLITDMGGEITPDIAEPIYVSIVTDTGSFRFSNTSSMSHTIASHLVAVGVNPRGIYERIYENSSIERIKLLGSALSELKLTAGERIAWVKITREMMEKIGATPKDCEGFADYLRLLKGVEVCLIFLEAAGGNVKVSLRSRGIVDVNKLAGEFGGGGHQHAAGLFVEGDIDKIEHALIHRAEEALSSS
jgi:phosphoesterase RecJ-like protein